MMSILAALIEPVSELIGKFVPDKDKANALAHDLATMADKHHHEAMLAQLEVNKVEAAHPSLFVSGWRPGAAWICVVAMGFNFILLPVLTPILTAYTTIVMLPLDWQSMSPVLLGMLGLGTIRGAEKLKGVARK